MIVDCFREKKILIKEVKDDELQLGIKITSIKGKEKIVDIYLNKIEIKQNAIIKFKNKNVFKNKKEEIGFIYDTSFRKYKNKLFKIKPINKIKKYKNEIIKLEYLYNNKEKNSSFFGMNFIKSNKNKCFIIFNNKKYNLINNIKELINKKKNKLILIKIRIIENIIDLAEMFFKCISLISLNDISKWNTNNVISMKNLFYGCSSLKSLPDISKWNTNKVVNMEGLFYGCSSLISLPDIWWLRTRDGSATRNW